MQVSHTLYWTTLHAAIAKHIPNAARKPHSVRLIHATDLAGYERIKAIERY
jgi:hypothetical protein